MESPSRRSRICDPTDVEAVPLLGMFMEHEFEILAHAGESQCLPRNVVLAEETGIQRLMSRRDDAIIDIHSKGHIDLFYIEQTRDDMGYEQFRVDHHARF